VQGVGFRPFVRNLAVAHDLAGWVRNTSAGVEIEVEGPPDDLNAFVDELVSRAPPRAQIEEISVRDIPANGGDRFAILESRPRPDAYQLVSPDIATCDDCLSELFDPDDRRSLYPFINCTNCGPRYTIIRDIPYDRPKTTMRAFRMCPACRSEYEDPEDRRFHAQPNACPACGPHLRLVDGRESGSRCPGKGLQNDSEVIASASRALKEGAILALKGLGGFQLACDAADDEAVNLLRARKRRPHKPFAIMMRSLEMVRRHCRVTPEEKALLCSPACPIVLLRWLDGSSLCASVAPGQRYLGVMLPYTPLHHLLLRETGRPLVMTSGNLSEEPIAKDNDEALRRLAPLADIFLFHDRDIHARYDDSVWFVPVSGRPQPIRRARGYAPSPVRVPFPLGRVLACGAELKNTFCLTRDRYAFVSQHIGDMENRETVEHFEETVAGYESLFRTKPAVIACDFHPDCLATRYGRKRAQDEHLPLVYVQHHHAHVASCMADNNWPAEAGRVLGVAFDGTGYGTDGSIWGGEFLIADYRGFQRCGHLEPLPLAGGEAAIHKPYRIALGWMQSCLGEIPGLPFLRSVSEEEIGVVRQMVVRGVNTPYTSSCGRLFDAVSALLDLCGRATYEGHAAVELEMKAGDLSRVPTGAGYPFTVESRQGRDVLCLDRLLHTILHELRAGRSAREISIVFHVTVSQMIVQMCERMRQETALSVVALSGGCFQNRLLLRLAVDRLEEKGFQVLTHHRVPCNDGGLSLGQAVVARHLYKGEG
jgi:hydrogenase maturation protein HypF